MTRASQIFNWASNGLSLLVLIAGACVLVKTYVLDRQPVALASQSAIASGEAVALPLAEDTRRRTLVLAISPDCPYCRASLPFYRRISALYDKRSLRTLALFPTSERIGSEFLASERLTVDFVRQADLSALGIAAVPTLMLVDAHGRLEQSWTGKLSASQEKQLLERLRTPASAVPTAQSGFRGIQLLALQAFVTPEGRSEVAALIDTRTREDFAKAHLAAARSLPADEVPVRARIEIASQAPVILYCDDGRPGSRSATIAGARTLCGASVLLLQLAGFGQIFVLDANLDDARNAGLEVRASAFVQLATRRAQGGTS